MATIANDNNGVIRITGMDDNVIQPFQLQASGLRGRIVRLGSVIDDILRAHRYPLAVSRLLADTVVLAASLSSMLKFAGIFTLQASGKGMIRSLVADIDSNGNLRGYAAFDAGAFEKSQPGGQGIYDGYSMIELMGEGYLAFTVDSENAQGTNTERYQGIVALEGETIGDSVRHYFEQSEQLRTSLYVASRLEEDGHWRAGALMLQFLPEISDGGDDGAIVTFGNKSEHERKEDWNRSRILLQSCTDDEILSTDLHPNDLLQRLFHEEGVIVYDPRAVQKNCRCSEEKVRNILSSMDKQELEEAATDGIIEMTCEFCSKTYPVPLDEFKS